MSASLIATIAVIAFLIVFIIIGICRGFLKIILTTFSLVITILLAGTFAKPLAEYVENGTVIGPRLEAGIETFVETKLSGISGAVGSAETGFINALPLTESMKEELIRNNNLAGYVDQGVDSFSEYMAVNLTSIVIKALCYVLLFLVIYLVLRLIIRLSNVINHIPVLGGINRLAGAIVSLAEGVLFLWLICMALMMLSGTPFGIRCEEVINGSVFLKWIYEHNYLMDIVNSVIELF